MASLRTAPGIVHVRFIADGEQITQPIKVRGRCADHCVQEAKDKFKQDNPGLELLGARFFQWTGEENPK